QVSIRDRSSTCMAWTSRAVSRIRNSRWSRSFSARRRRTESPSSTATTSRPHPLAIPLHPDGIIVRLLLGDGITTKLDLLAQFLRPLPGSHRRPDRATADREGAVDPAERVPQHEAPGPAGGDADAEAGDVVPRTDDDPRAPCRRGEHV